MPNNFISSQADIFDNPFDDINANVIEPQKILNLWCDPFGTELVKDINAKKFATQKLPIILQGSRGSGKTTLLKYFSYPVQKERAKERKDASLLKQIKSESSIGFYFRCDDSFINTFKSIFQGQSKENWLSFFAHYLELTFCKQLINVMLDLKTENDINVSINESTFFEELKNNISILPLVNINSFDKMLNYIIEELRYIDIFKSESIFSDSRFCPTVLLTLYSLSEAIIKTISIVFPELKSIMYLILVDEFENLTEELQQFFNTSVKFSKEFISLRIGRRNEGIITTATINSTEYLREKHDYFLVEINKGLNFEIQKKYFEEIAIKRLSLSKFTHLSNGIIGLLGDKEDLDQECLDICKGRCDHLTQILSEKAILCRDVGLRNKVVEIICCPQNPIAETINALWVIRSKDDPLTAATNAKLSMLSFFEKDQTHPNWKKYKNDYSNKYRYSITCLIASIYKRKKMYYGFNTIAHLADGNIRTFINLCRAIISDAIFFEKTLFFENKTISSISQNRAISEFAASEFDSICSIINFGNKIRNLILNVGNVFSEYHKDKKVRYPETNQFVFNKLELTEEIQKVVDTAESWSMIVRREKTQRLSASIDRKGDIFYISRVFSPIFSISYRIRGGVNVQFKSTEIINMMTTLSTVKKLSQHSKSISENLKQEQEQINLFDIEVE